MFIRYRISDSKVVYAGDKRPLNKEDGAFAIAEVDNIPETNNYLIYKNGVVEAVNKTQEELNTIENQLRIAELKQQLTETDYKAIKFAEGFYTAEEYEPIKQQRAAVREEINRLES